MAATDFLSPNHEQQVVDAIKKAEKQTSGEIRVHIEEHCAGEPLERADVLFHSLGMTQTELQNGVLIYIAHADKKAAVYAGKGIHKVVEDGFWSDILSILLTHFKKEAFTEGIEKAITTVGTKLTELFPYQADDSNELSDKISYNNQGKS